MIDDNNLFLLFGAAGSAVAAAAHVGCIIFGAPWYRFFGAGEKLARLDEAGSSLPARITSGIVLVLAFWSYCALAGAGLAPQPPFLRALLCGIALVYLLRASIGFVMKKRMPGRSDAFWLWSSAICGTLGAAYLVGTIRSWPAL